MKDVFNGTKVEGLGDIGLLKLEAWLIPQVLNVAAAAGQEVINANDGVAFGQQSVTKM